MSSDSPDPPTWAKVELMGHVTIAGRLTEEEKFGSKIGRIDIPHEGGFVTQYFGGSSVYRITLVSEEAARLIASRSTTQPISSWDLPKRIEAREQEPQRADLGRDSDEDEYDYQPEDDDR